MFLAVVPHAKFLYILLYKLVPLYLVYTILRFFVSCLTSGNGVTGDGAAGYDNKDNGNGNNDDNDDGNKDGGGRRRQRGGGGGGAGVRIRWGRRLTGRRNHATATTLTLTLEQTTTNHCALKAPGKRRPAEIAACDEKGKDNVDEERTSKEDSQSV